METSPIASAPADDVQKTDEQIANAESDAALGGWTEQQDAANIVPFFLGVDDFGPKFLKKLADDVIADHDQAWGDSDEYRTKRRDNYALLTGTLPKKSFPFDGCANAHMPVFLERYLRLSANVFVELFTDREVLFTVTPTGPDDQEEAEILTLHANWQLKNELTDFFRQQAAGVGEFFAAGSVFCHSYRDTINNRNRHDILNCEELVIPFVGRTVETDMSDVPFKIRILRRYRNEVQRLGAAKEWEQTQILLKKGPPSWDSGDTKVRDKAAESEGIRAPEGTKRAPWILYEYHGWYRMPGEDRERPICVTVDKNSRTVVKLYLREENDWRDQMRFDQQSEELGLHQQAMQQHEQLMAQHQQAMLEHAQIQSQEGQLQQLLQQPHVDPEHAAAVTQALGQDPLQQPRAPIPPNPPMWLKPGMQAPNPVRRVPIENFSHGVCFENPNGMLGLSPGHILADLNRLNDEALNRFYDSATLANIQAYAVPEGFDLGSSTVGITPGKIYKVKGFTGEQIRNSIHEFRASPANQQLLDMVRMVGDEADSSVAAPGVLSGEPGKSGETYRGVVSRKESATKQLSMAGLKYVDFLTNISRNNARLNALFMDEQEIINIGEQFQEARKFTVDPATGAPKPQLRVSRDMYRRSWHVTFTADMRFSSQEQKISQVDEVLAMINSMPPLQSSPALVYATIAKAFRLRGLSELIPTLGPAPPMPTVPFGTPPSPPPGAPPGQGGQPGEPPGPPQGMPPEAPPVPAPGGPQ